MINKLKNIAKNIWNFLDGKKTTIAYLITMLSQTLPEGKLKEIIFGVSLLLGGTGISHKVSKNLKKE